MRNLTQQSSSDFLTSHEHQAITDAGKLYTHIANNIIAHGATRDDDLQEIRTAIHVIQHAIMAQAAARAYPTRYRLLGDVIHYHHLGEPAIPGD
jgi:hypothetical protein